MNENFDKVDLAEELDSYIKQEKLEFLRKEITKSLRAVLSQIFDQKASYLQEQGDNISFARLPVKEHTLDLLMEKYGSFIDTLGE